MLGIVRAASGRISVFGHLGAQGSYTPKGLAEGGQAPTKATVDPDRT